MTFEEACGYAGNSGKFYDIMGNHQLDLLKKNGCKPHHKVLEIGCGALSAGSKIMAYLDRGNYAGLEPNMDVLAAGMNRYEKLHKEKEARFSPTNEFLAPFPCQYVISHSVINHCTVYQVETMLDACYTMLRDNGVIIASLRLGDNTNPTEWQYPQSIFISHQTITGIAERCGFEAKHMPKYREKIVKTAPLNVHDWFIFTRQ